MVGVEVWVELAALGLAVWAASRSVPRPPRLHWERLFKTALAAQAAGQQPPPEPEALLGALLHQPAGGPAPEKKLLDPATAPVPVPPLEGERALVEALTKLPGVAERLRRMYVEDQGAQRAVFEDPEALGPDYHPSRLGAGLDWGAVAAWSEPLQAALTRRLGAVVMVELGAGVAAELAAAAPGLRAAAVEPAAGPEALAEALLALAQSPSDRLALFVGGDAALPALRALVSSPALRDRLVAVVSVGGLLGETPEDRAWLAENFVHEALEPELNRAIPYAAVLEVDPEEALAPSRPDAWEKQRFPVPAPSSSGRDAIDAIDLGPLVLRKVPRAQLARALAIFLAYRLLD